MVTKMLKRVPGPFPRCKRCDHPDFEHELCPRVACAGEECFCTKTVEEVRQEAVAA